MEALGEAQEDEHRERAADLDGDERVDRPASNDDEAEGQVAAEERGGRGLERVQAGDSDFRFMTRSCRVTCSSSMSITNAFGLRLAA